METLDLHDQPATEKKILWFCPLCENNNYAIGDCENTHCTYSGLKEAVQSQIKAIEAKRTGKGLTSFLTSIIVLALVVGVPIGLFFGLYITDWTKPPAPINPVVYTNDILPQEVEDAVKGYVSANWNGWQYKGYDQISSNYSIDEADISAFVEKDGRTLEIKLQGKLIYNGAAESWVITPKVDHYEKTE